MTLMALTTSGRIGIVIAGVAIVWVVFAVMTAEHGRGKGYPFFPLFVAALFLGFPLVLLAITIGAGPTELRR